MKLILQLLLLFVTITIAQTADDTAAATTPDSSTDPAVTTTDADPATSTTTSTPDTSTDPAVISTDDDPAISTTTFGQERVMKDETEGATLETDADAGSESTEKEENYLIYSNFTYFPNAIKGSKYSMTCKSQTIADQEFLTNFLVVACSFVGPILPNMSVVSWYLQT